MGKIDVSTAKDIISNTGVCGVYWSVNDFKCRAKELNELTGMEFDETKFQTVLEKMCNQHDASIGITWETIDSYLDIYCQK